MARCGRIVRDALIREQSPSDALAAGHEIGVLEHAGCCCWSRRRHEIVVHSADVQLPRIRLPPRRGLRDGRDDVVHKDIALDRRHLARHPGREHRPVSRTMRKTVRPGEYAHGGERSHTFNRENHRLNVSAARNALIQALRRVQGDACGVLTFPLCRRVWVLRLRGADNELKPLISADDRH